MEARRLPADRTAAALEALLRVLEAVAVAAREQLVRRHFVEADGLTGHSGLERLRRARAPSRSASFSSSLSRLFLRSLSFFAALLGAAFAPLNLVVSPLRPIVVVWVSKSVAAALLEQQHTSTSSTSAPTSSAPSAARLTLGWLCGLCLPPATSPQQHHTRSLAIPSASFRTAVPCAESTHRSSSHVLPAVFAGRQALPQRWMRAWGWWSAL